MNKDEIWAQALSTLLANVEEEDPKSVFLHLLAPLQIFGDQYVLLAENQHVEQWVTSRYKEQIMQAVDAVAGTHYDVHIMSKTSIETPPGAAASTPEPAPAAAEKRTKPSPQVNLWDAPAEAEGAQPSADNDWMNTYVDPAEITPRSATPTPTPAAAQRNISGADRELSERCTFENFVVGQSNEFARAAALAVAEQPGTAYNPLFIYGKPGLGKTHLLLSIANYINRNMPHLNTLYVPADTFTEEYINSLKTNNMKAYNDKYSGVDVLLIDDVQRLEKKTETTNQLFNIFNDMTMNNKQIVLSADRNPKEIDLDERMRSRFRQGLLADIKPPDYETRLAIIRNFVAREEEKTPFYAVIPEEVQNWLAEISVPTIRDIQGAIIRLIGHMSLGKKSSLTVEEAKEILQDFFPDRTNRQVSIAVIQSEVERMYGVSHEELISKKRTKNITYPRHIAIYLSRFMTEESLQDIGKKFGGRDHTTVMHSVNIIEMELKDNKVLFDQLDQLQLRIKERS